jgi:hypothetical protein
MRWISTVALQANLQGEDGTGEGANGTEGARTPARGRARLVGRRTCLRVGGPRTPGGAHAPASGRARMPGGARDVIMDVFE